MATSTTAATADDKKSDKKILETAQKRLRSRLDEDQEERVKQLDDLRFSTLDQWPTDVRKARENDPTGARPCLTIDKINQYVVQVTNDMRQNRSAIKPRPVDDAADVETAKIFAGLIRHIEDNSHAGVAYDTAGESAVRIGEGYFRVVTEYENEKSFDQKLMVKPIPNAFSVVLGPHVLPDGSDCEYGFVYEDVTKEKFKREWPKAKTEGKDFVGLGEFDVPGASEDTIRVAEYFYTDFKAAELVFLADGRSMLKSEYDALPEFTPAPPQMGANPMMGGMPMPMIPRPEITDTRRTSIPSIKWCKITGAEILDRKDWLGKYVPLIKVIGKEAWVEGKRHCWGLVRPAKDSLRMYNYWASTITEKLALSPKTPFIGAVGQFATQGAQWDKANTQNFSRLEYDQVSIDGQVAPPPQRSQPAAMEVAMIKQLELIEHDIQTSLGMFNASVGRSAPQQSGKAILALTRESDTGTFHFPDNMNTSIRYAGRILIDLIPKIYDTRRVMQILGEDGEVTQATHDPAQQASSRQIQTQQGVKAIYNLNVGEYDVTVTTGPSYNTKRMEAANVFTDLANSAKDPVTANVMRYLAVKNSDFDSSAEAVVMLKKLLPPQLQGDGQQPQIPPQVQQQMQAHQQQIQKLTQELQQAQAGTQQAMAKVQADAQAAQMKVAADAQSQKVKSDLHREEVEAELHLKAVTQAEDIRLGREKAQAEIALKREIAEAELHLEASVMSQKNEIAMTGVKLDHSRKSIADASAATGEQATVAKATSDNADLIRALTAPKRITVIRADGTPLSAEVTLQ